MKRKIFGILLTLVLAVTGFGLVGCGGGNNQSPAPGPGPEPGPEVTYNDDTTPVLMEESVFMFTEPVSSLKTPEDGEEEEEFFVGVCGLKEAVNEAVIPAYVKDEDNNVYKVSYLDEYALTVDGAPEVELLTEVDDEEEVLVKVTIPSTVEYISDNAFAGCIELQEIVLNNRETVIQNFNFALQDLLFELVDAGYTLEEVYELMNMEEEADGLLYFGNPQNPYMYLVTSVGEPYYDSPLSFVYPDGAVDTTDGVEVTVNENCLIIGEEAFCDTNVTKVNLPEGLLAIGDYAFDECWNLDELVIPASVKHLGSCIVYDTNLYIDSANLAEDLQNNGDFYILKDIVDDAEEDTYSFGYIVLESDYDEEQGEWGDPTVYTHDDKEYYHYYYESCEE